MHVYDVHWTCSNFVYQLQYTPLTSPLIPVYLCQVLTTLYHNMIVASMCPQFLILYQYYHECRIAVDVTTWHIYLPHYPSLSFSLTPVSGVTRLWASLQATLLPPTPPPESNTRQPLLSSGHPSKRRTLWERTWGSQPELVWTRIHNALSCNIVQTMATYIHPLST